MHIFQRISLLFNSFRVIYVSTKEAKEAYKNGNQI